MSSKITCPVCQFAHIPQDWDTCPQCDSDLVCFKLLDALPDLPEDSAGKHTTGPEESWRRIPWSAFGLGVILLMLVSLVGYASHHFYALESMMQKNDADMAQVKNMLNQNPNKMMKRIEAGTQQMNHIEKRVEELVAMTKEKASQIPESQGGMEKPCFNVYRAKKEDTLWTIARDLYGSGMLYPILMENNPDLHIYSIGSKDSIRYLCDKTLAAGIYKTITDMKQNRVFWKYKVRTGETRKDIINRYCLNQKDCLVDDKPLEPGMTIGVFLE